MQPALDRPRAPRRLRLATRPPRRGAVDPLPSPAVTFEEALSELGIDRDASQDHARRAYLKLLKTRKPEADPEGFMRLREAFDLVKRALESQQAFRRMMEARTAPRGGPPPPVEEPAVADAPAPADVEAAPEPSPAPGDEPTPEAAELAQPAPAPAPAP